MPEPKEHTGKIPFSHFAKVSMVVGEIQSAERVPETDKLLKLSVDLGEESPRQIISGIAEFFPDPQELVGKRCVFAENLESREIRGLVSDGMILAAHTDDNTFALLVPEENVPSGTRIA